MDVSASSSDNNIKSETVQNIFGNMSDNLPSSVKSTLVKLNLPSSVINSLVKLSSEVQAEFIEDYHRKAKSVPAAYIFWLFGGLHYAYLRRWGRLVLYVVTCGGVLIWAIFDVFRIPAMVRKYNNEVATEIVNNLKIMHS